MPEYVVNRIAGLLNRRGRAVKGTRILLLGIAYKAGTSDWRESPSLAVAERLGALGAEVRACDPHIPAVLRSRVPVPLVDLDGDVLAAADLVVVLVDHPEFVPDEVASRSRLVFDAKALLRGHTFEGEIL
jgi:UDP-N-acetyl-D-mannosaminuronic acid dehydrogenase/UDP-N-acetyl-D-glucosamine dehydrogenase